MLNERICATALYYLDSENITSSSLAFRMETERDQNELNYAAGQDAYNWLERVYGANFREDLNLQYYGRVETREGRMLAFPNVLSVLLPRRSLPDPSPNAPMLTPRFSANIALLHLVSKIGPSQDIDLSLPCGQYLDIDCSIWSLCMNDVAD